MEETLTKTGETWTIERTSPEGKTMSEIVTEWMRFNNVVPTQPLYTSVLDMQPDNKETQRKRRVVCSLVGVIQNEEANASPEVKAQEAAQESVLEEVIEQLVHKGYNVQVGGVRPEGEVSPSK
jgi:hypothetical protein